MLTLIGALAWRRGTDVHCVPGKLQDAWLGLVVVSLQALTNLCPASRPDIQSLLWQQQDSRQQLILLLSDLWSLSLRIPGSQRLPRARLAGVLLLHNLCAPLPARQRLLLDTELPLLRAVFTRASAIHHQGSKAPDAQQEEPALEWALRLARLSLLHADCLGRLLPDISCLDRSEPMHAEQHLMACLLLSVAEERLIHALESGPQAEYPSWWSSLVGTSTTTTTTTATDSTTNESVHCPLCHCSGKSSSPPSSSSTSTSSSSSSPTSTSSPSEQSCSSRFWTDVIRLLLACDTHVPDKAQPLHAHAETMEQQSMIDGDTFAACLSLLFHASASVSCARIAIKAKAQAVVALLARSLTTLAPAVINPDIHASLRRQQPTPDSAGPPCGSVDEEPEGQLENTASPQRPLLCRNIVALLANISDPPTPAMQALLRESGALHGILSQTGNTDHEANPFMREWAVFALRNALHQCPENQELVRCLQLQETEIPQELVDMGFQVTIKDGRPVLTRRGQPSQGTRLQD